RPGLINLDFADVKTIMKGMGKAVMGTGIASGENRATDAAKKAMNSPLLAEGSIEGARGILINITASENLTMYEVNEASKLIHECADEDATIIFGAAIANEMKDDVKVTVIATGFEKQTSDTLMPALKAVAVGAGHPQQGGVGLQTPPEAASPFYRKAGSPRSGLPVSTERRHPRNAAFSCLAIATPWIPPPLSANRKFLVAGSLGPASPLFFQPQSTQRLARTQRHRDTEFGHRELRINAK